MKKTLLFLLSSVAIASASPMGIEIFKQCGTCHGDKGQKHSLNVTHYIAGMDKDDVIEILHEYKAGTRNKYGLGSMMKGQAAKLSDEQMDAVASYIESLPVVVEKVVIKKEDTTLDGKKIFKKCAVCHGVDANKRSLNVSKFIAGMDKDHIIETLHGYQAGKINQYGFGSMMKGQAKKLTEKQLEAVALYVESLERKSEDTDSKKMEEKKKITQEEIEYNKFLKEHFDKSTNPNETYEEGKRRWAEEKKKREAEANATKEKSEKVKEQKPAASATEVNLDTIETAGEEPKEESSWF